MSFDPMGIFTVLVEHEVRFVVIGGFAGNLRGSADITQDLDICYARTDADLEKLVGALVALEATLRVARAEEGERIPFQLDVRSLRAGDSFTFTTRLGDFDILGTPTGTSGFEDLDRGATTMDIGEGRSIRVASIDDLIRMKRASRRTKDLLHVEHLAALRDEIEAFRAAGEDPEQGT
jgi:hypothetical protein